MQSSLEIQARGCLESRSRDAALPYQSAVNIVAQLLTSVRSFSAKSVRKTSYFFRTGFDYKCENKALSRRLDSEGETNTYGLPICRLNE